MNITRTAVPALLSAAVGTTLVCAAPAAAAPGPAPAPATSCAAGDLDLAVGTPDPGAGQLYVPLGFTNIGDRSCTLLGHPGVSVLDADRQRIGSPADREGTASGPVTLAPGRSATAVLHTTNGPIGGPCLDRGTFLKVYPPASKDEVLVKASFQICSDRFTVGPLTA
ncbi:DUF4232 domain-containing protein [Streptomyces virginiae]|uniref:DUF4232 domain-containing protein n=1 Tax=Streptomyces virginiae TaxID=1961 RepID=UPI00069D2924|nr:DUF4232 domain-containing protein [Streptomyces virginiae]